MEDESELARPIATHYSKVLADDGLSLPWRLLTLENLLGWDKRIWSDEMILQGMSLLARAWESKMALPDDYFREFLSHAASLPDAAPWQQRAGQIIAAYHAFQPDLSRTQRSGTSHDASGHGNYIPMVQLALLEMSIRSARADSLNRFIEQDELATNLDAWALLIKYGKTDEARKLMRRGWRNVDRVSSRLYTLEFERHLKPCLASMGETDVRYYCELLLSALMDGAEGDAPIHSRDARLEGLAQRYRDVSFPDSTLRQTALLVLSQSDRALLHVADSLAEEAKGIDLGAAVNPANGPERVSQSELALAYARATLIQGDPDAFLRAVESVIAESEKQKRGRSSQYERVLEQMARRLRVIIAAPGFRCAPAQLEDLALLCGRLSGSPARHTPNQERTRLWGHCVAMYVLAGDEDLLASARARVPRSRWNEFGYHKDRTDTFLALAKLSSDMDLKRKTHAIERYFALDFVKLGLRRSKSSFGPLYSLLKHGVLTEEEILKEGAELINLGIHPDRNWGRLATIQAKHGRLDEANASWRRSIEACRIPDQLWRQTLAYARFLREHGQSDMALLYVQKVDPRRLSKKYRDQRHEWVTKLADTPPASKNNVTNP